MGPRSDPTRSRLLRARRRGGVVVALGISAATVGGCAVDMPGRSYTGPLPALSAGQAALAAELRADVEMLAGTIGERNVFNPEKLAAAEAYLTAELERAGLAVRKQVFAARGVECANIEAEVPGHSGAAERAAAAESEIVIVGAHYDAVRGCPAANDNGSGAAAVLALARRFAPRPGMQVGMARTIRFVFFVNEEPPFFWTGEMGSLVYARECRDRGARIAAMLSIETIGCYSDEEGSQQYPPVVGAFYPSRGDFIAFVGLYEARELVERCVGAFRLSAPFPSEGAALTALVPRVTSSDHWSFWKMGYPALMVTDTAPYRYPHYHQPTDTPDKLDYERMARVVEGLEGVVWEIANSK